MEGRACTKIRSAGVRAMTARVAAAKRNDFMKGSVPESHKMSGLVPDNGVIRQVLNNCQWPLWSTKILASLERLNKLADGLGLLFAQTGDGFVVRCLGIRSALCYLLGDLTCIQGRSLESRRFHGWLSLTVSTMARAAPLFIECVSIVRALDYRWRSEK